jgi:hypothetical protein
MGRESTGIHRMERMDEEVIKKLARGRCAPVSYTVA